MNITPGEIDSIDNIGTLDGNPLKMLRTKGGFFICIGRPKGQMSETALGAGSHPAIVKYNIEKQYPQVQIAMMKSEALSDGSIVDKHSHHLSHDLRKSGHDIYSVQKGSQITFHITKQNVDISKVDGYLENDYILFKNINFPKEFAKSIAGACVEKAITCKAKKLKLGSM